MASTIHHWLPLRSTYSGIFLSTLICLTAILSIGTSSLHASEATESKQLFDKHVLPMLKQHCYRCHSHETKKSRGGLVVDSKNGLLKGGDSGPAVVPGQPEKSLLLKAICYTEEDLRMPPKGKLADEVIAHVENWIKLGAEDSRQVVAGTPRKHFEITDADRNHWAFQPLAKTNIPAVGKKDWCRNQIDHFVLSKLEQKGIRPNADADRITLLRRLTFDLTGLPPTPSQMERFAKDDSSDAYEKLVDELLSSPEFGPKWARHWLDGVRYASDIDKSGTYRDWVVRSLQNDLPYDEFVRMQIAGDLIRANESDPTKIHESGATLDGVAASGMLALAVWERVARDLAVAEIVDSQIDVVGRQFLGLTLACARCHDHKFDAISQKDYYALAGIFFSSHITPGKIIADGRLSSDVIRRPLLNKIQSEHNANIQTAINQLKEQINKLEKTAEKAVKLRRTQTELKSLSAKLAKATGATKTKLLAEQKKLTATEKSLVEDQKKHQWDVNPPEISKITEIEGKIAAQEKKIITATTAIAAKEGGVPGTKFAEIGNSKLFIRGDFRKVGDEVPRRFPTILAGEDQESLAKKTTGSGRLELANWMVNDTKHLLARVHVNRVWQHLLGHGIVRSPDNFGRLGKSPTHPELLDFLAKQFIESGWSTKKLIREIVLSSTYRQSSATSAGQMQADPENLLLGRMNRKRLQYEALRDSLLQVSGQLTSQGGKAKRTLFEPVLRNKLNVDYAIFDGADPHTIVVSRPTTTTTTQALYLMNSPFVAKCAQMVVERLQAEKSLQTDTDRINYAYRLLLGRQPTEQEMGIGESFLEQSSLASYVQLLMCTNEFVYLD